MQVSSYYVLTLNVYSHKTVRQCIDPLAAFYERVAILYRMRLIEVVAIDSVWFLCAFCLTLECVFCVVVRSAFSIGALFWLALVFFVNITFNFIPRFDAAVISFGFVFSLILLENLALIVVCSTIYRLVRGKC